MEVDREGEASGERRGPGAGWRALRARSPSGGAGLAAAAVIGALVVGTLLSPISRVGAREAAAPPASVETVRVQRSPGYSVEESYSGRVEAARTVDLAFEQGGTLQFVMAEEGSRVAVGETLAQLETRSLKAELRQQLASREAFSASLDLSRDSLDRLAELDRRGFAADQSLVNARSDVVRASAALDEVNAGIVALEIAIAKADLKAPFDGVVGRRALDAGDQAGAGQPVLTLFDDSSATVRVGLPPTRLATLAVGETYAVVDGDAAYAARYVGARPDLGTATRTVEARFEIEDAPAVPPYGQLVELRLTRTVAEPGYWLPMGALSEGERGLWSVLLIEEGEAASDPERPPVAGADGEGRIARRHVELLHADGDRAYVRADLPEGARVVARGGHRVVDGQRVRIARAAS